MTKHKTQRKKLLSHWSGSHVDNVGSSLGETGPKREWSNGTEFSSYRILLEWAALIKKLERNLLLISPSL